MKNGGVLIALIQDGGAASGLTLGYLLQNIYNDPNIKRSNLTGGGSLYPFPANKIYRANFSDEDWYFYMESMLKDPILNGPFGDVREMQWGEDASVTLGVESIAIENDAWDFTKAAEKNQGKNTVIYSRATNLNIPKSASPTINNKITGLKYESDIYNMVWFGDGGFTSHEGDLNGGTRVDACPFAYDANFFPIPRKELYGFYKRHQAYNAPAFCNIMAWAIERAISPELRAKKDALLNSK